MTAPVGAVAVLRAPRAARVLGASLLGRLPLGAGPLALLVFARERLSLGSAAVLVAAFTAGIAVGGPLLARAADRWRQAPVLWLAVAGSTLGYALVAGSTAVAVGAVGAALAGLGAPPFEACLRVLWRDLVPPAVVPSAYTVDIAAQELIFIVGPLATVLATAVLGAAGGLYACAACQLAGTAWFATAAVVLAWRGEQVRRHWLGALRSGALRVILVAIVLVGAAVGAVIVAITGYAEARGSTASAGWLIAAQAFGALIGGLGYARVRSTSPRSRLTVLAAAMAVSYAPLLLQPPPVAMGLLLVLSGLGLPVLLTVTFLIVDRVAPAGTAAEAFAWVATAFAIGSAGGSAATGVLIDAAGSVRIGFLVSTVALAVAAAVFALLLLGSGPAVSDGRSAPRAEP
jgi:predicted MFS family arabinose efflux permease